MENTVTEIDMSTYARKAQFEHFRPMADPYAGVTVNVDVSSLAEQCSLKGRSFTLAFLHTAALAWDDVPELRQRIHGDGIVEYAHCPSSHIELLPDGSYCYCNIYHHGMDWTEYFLQAEKAQEDARKARIMTDGDDIESYVFVSNLPWVHYTDLKAPSDSDGMSNPHIFWGGYEEDWKGRLMMPVTLHAHHALADGYHYGLFFNALNRRIREADLSDLPVTEKQHSYADILKDLLQS